MKLDIGETFDSIMDGTKEVAEAVHIKTSEFHKNYVSKVLPDCGKYGKAATFLAEMVPGVTEYNAIKDGDWKAFAIAAGIDVTAAAAGAVTAGAGFAAVKGGSNVAKTGVKRAVREITEAGTGKAVKEVTRTGIEKSVKEVAETSAEKAVKEVTEVGAEKNMIEVSKEGMEKTTREVTEKIATKDLKEISKKLDKTRIPEYLQEVQKITNREIKPIQMEKLEKALKEQDFIKLDHEKAKFHRKLFDNAREKLIQEWEKYTGDAWPVYDHDIISSISGEVLKKAGQPYDAHHLIESSFGGPNAWWNLHPAAFPDEHQGEIHAANSLANKIF